MKIPLRYKTIESKLVKNQSGEPTIVRALSWFASCGYQTDFRPIAHFAFQFLDGEIWKTLKITRSEKLKNETLEYWNTIAV